MAVNSSSPILAVGLIETLDSHAQLRRMNVFNSVMVKSAPMQLPLKPMYSIEDDDESARPLQNAANKCDSLRHVMTRLFTSELRPMDAPNDEAFEKAFIQCSTPLDFHVLFEKTF